MWGGVPSAVAPWGGSRLILTCWGWVCPFVDRRTQMHQKKVAFISKQLGELFFRFNLGDCPPTAREPLFALTAALRDHRRDEALAVQQRMSTESWRDQGAPWMATAVSGLHLLIKLIN